MYLPLIGIFICAIHFFEEILRDKKVLIKKLIILFLIFYLAFFSIRTILRNREWQNPIVFYNQILQYNASYRVYNNLGIAYEEIGEYEKAKENYFKAINFDPTSPRFEAYNNLGIVFLKQKKYDEAIFYFKEALKLNKNYPITIINLGDAYFQKGDFTAAKEEYLLAVELFPHHFYPYFKLGETAFYEKNCSEAISYLNQAKEVAPPDREIQEKLFLLIKEAQKCQNFQ